GVRTVHEWQWVSSSYDGDEMAARACHEQKCWTQKLATKIRQQLRIPDDDPVGSKADALSRPSLYVYSATFTRDELARLQASTLYIPGIRARHVSIWVNGQSILQSPGDLPYFVDLTGRLE